MGNCLQREELAIIQAACPIIGQHLRLSTLISSFSSLFGVNVSVASKAYQEIASNARLPRPYTHFSRKHFLWGLYFMKVYPTDVAAASFLNCNKQTFRKWSQHTVKHISLLYGVKVSS